MRQAWIQGESRGSSKYRYSGFDSKGPTTHHHPHHTTSFKICYRLTDSSGQGEDFKISSINARFFFTEAQLSLYSRALGLDFA